MIDLFRLVSVRYLVRRPVRSLIALLTVALSVALYVSTEVAHAGVTDSVARTLRDLRGRAEWIVTEQTGGGVASARLAAIRKLPGVIAAPIVQATLPITAPEDQPLLLLGIDMASDAMLRLYNVDRAPTPAEALALLLTPDAVLLTRAFATRHHLAVGAPIRVRGADGVRTLTMVATIADNGPAAVFEGRLALMDVRAAAKLTGRPGRYDRIEVAGATRDQLRAACPGCRVDTAMRSNSVIDDALARFRSLVAVSVMGFLVGIFIIYNTVSVTVFERLKLIGTLRAIGASRRQVQAVLIIEWVVLGAIGAVLGVVGGWLLARGLVQFAAATINTLVLLVDVRELPLPASTAVIGVIAGTLVAAVAAWFPAHQALAVTPIRILRPRAYRLTAMSPWPARVGLGLLVLGGVLFFAAKAWTTAGLACTGLFFVAIALALPAGVRRIARALAPVLARAGFGAGWLGIDNVVKFPERTALTATALAGTLAMMIAAATLVTGFNVALGRWMTNTFPFDVSVSATDMKTTVYSDNAFSPALRDLVAAQPGVASAYGVRVAFLEFRERDIMVIALDMAAFEAAHARKGQAAILPAAQRTEVLAGTGVLASENFGARFGIGAGETIELPTPEGPRAFHIASLQEDYSWPQGVIIVDLAAYRRIWHDDLLTYINVCVNPGVDRWVKCDELRTTLGASHDAHVYTVAHLRDGAEQAIRQVMVFADVQVFIAILIGLLGSINTLLISVLQRTREIGLLRASGASRRQVATMVVAEALFIGVIGGMVGVAAGLVGGWGPLRMFTFATTGYLTPIVVPWPEVSFALAAAVIVGIVASIIPARLAARTDVLTAISYE